MYTFENLKPLVDKHKMLDVSFIDIPEEEIQKFMDARYSLHGFVTRQKGTNKHLHIKVISVPGTTQKHVWQNRARIGHLQQEQKEQASG